MMNKQLEDKLLHSLNYKVLITPMKKKIKQKIFKMSKKGGGGLALEMKSREIDDLPVHTDRSG